MQGYVYYCTGDSEWVRHYLKLSVNSIDIQECEDSLNAVCSYDLNNISASILSSGWKDRPYSFHLERVGVYLSCDSSEEMLQWQSQLKQVQLLDENNSDLIILDTSDQKHVVQPTCISDAIKHVYYSLLPIMNPSTIPIPQTPAQKQLNVKVDMMAASRVANQLLISLKFDHVGEITYWKGSKAINVQYGILSSAREVMLFATLDKLRQFESQCHNTSLFLERYTLHGAYFQQPLVKLSDKPYAMELVLLDALGTIILFSHTIESVLRNFVLQTCQRALVWYATTSQLQLIQGQPDTTMFLSKQAIVNQKVHSGLDNPEKTTRLLECLMKTCFNAKGDVVQCISDYKRKKILHTYTLLYTDGCVGFRVFFGVDSNNSIYSPKQKYDQFFTLVSGKDIITVETPSMEEALNWVRILGLIACDDFMTRAPDATSMYSIQQIPKYSNTELVEKQYLHLKKQAINRNDRDMRKSLKISRLILTDKEKKKAHDDVLHEYECMRSLMLFLSKQQKQAIDVNDIFLLCNHLCCLHERPWRHKIVAETSKYHPLEGFALTDDVSRDVLITARSFQKFIMDHKGMTSLPPITILKQKISPDNVETGLQKALAVLLPYMTSLKDSSQRTEIALQSPKAFARRMQTEDEDPAVLSNSNSSSDMELSQSIPKDLQIGQLALKVYSHDSGEALEQVHMFIKQNPEGYVMLLTGTTTKLETVIKLAPNSTLSCHKVEDLPAALSYCQSFGLTLTTQAQKIILALNSKQQRDALVSTLSSIIQADENKCID